MNSMKYTIKTIICALLLVFLNSCQITNSNKNDEKKIQIRDFFFDNGMMINYDKYISSSRSTEFFLPFQFKMINNSENDLYKEEFVDIDFYLNKINNTNDFIKVSNRNKDVIKTDKNGNQIFFFNNLNPFKIGDTIKCYGYFSFPKPTDDDQDYISYINNPLNYFKNNIPCDPIIKIKYGLEDIFIINGDNIKNEIIMKYNKSIIEKIVNIESIFDKEKLLLNKYEIKTN